MEENKEQNIVSIKESEDSSFFYSSVENIVNNLFNVINESMKEWILNIKVDVRISLLNKNSHLTHKYYLEIENQETVKDYIQVVKSNTDSGNSYTNDKRDLVVKNVKLKDLHIFDSFLNRDYFYNGNRNSEYLNIRDWIQSYKIGLITYDRAREAEITFKPTIWNDENQKKDIKVKILCSGSGDGGYGGVDIDIMQDGKNFWFDKPQLYFATNVVEFDSNSIKDFNNNGFMEVFNNKLNANESIKENYKKHLRNIVNITIKEENNLLNDIFSAYKTPNSILDNTFKKNRDDVHIYTKPDKANSKLKPFNNESRTFFNEVNKELADLEDNIKNSLKDEISKSDIMMKYLINKNIFQKQKQYIMYNNFPLFEIKFNNSVENFNIESFQNKNKNIPILWFYIQYYIDNIDKKNIVNIKNISSIAWEKSEENNFNYKYSSEIPVYITNYDSINNKRQTLLIGNEENSYKPNNWKGSDKNHKVTLDNGIFGAINTYNKNILAMSNSSYNKFKESNSFVQPENILVLKNNEQRNLKTTYAKILSQREYSPDMFNPSLWLGKNLDKMANNEFSEKRIRELYHKIEPSKIVVVYDITGKVINPGIGLDGIANTSNDALYDSEKNILDNLYRTTIIKKDPNMSYYLNDDGTYTLIINKVNWIYSLKWENTTNYFATYNDTKRYLKEMIKIDTIKIKI